MERGLSEHSSRDPVSLGPFSIEDESSHGPSTGRASRSPGQHKGSLYSNYSNNKLEMLRKRQLAAKNSPAVSLKMSGNCADSSDIYDASPSNHNEWLSEDGSPQLNEADSSPSNRRTRKCSVRSRRRPSNVVPDVSLSTPVRQSPRRSISNSVKRSGGKSDQRWITLLERNNEELISQVNALTSTLSTTEKTLQTSLKISEEEIVTLKEQLLERDRAQERMIEQFRKRVTPLRSQDAERIDVAGTHQIRGLRQHAEIESRVKALLAERETFLLKIKRKDDELLRIKKRNAELAEQILHKRSLEITVEGQNRYLLELSSALNETRKAVGSEPSSSPRCQSSPALPPSPLFTPTFLGQTESRARPVSFDGTRWAHSSLHQRHHSLMELGDFLPRPEPSPVFHPTFSDSKNVEPPSPPLTENERSPSLHHEPADEHPDAIRDKGSITLRNLPAQKRKSSSQFLRPSLQRNESSLWYELHKDLDQIGERDELPTGTEPEVPETTDLAVSSQRTKAAEVGLAMISSVRDSQGMLRQYAFRIRGDAVSSTIELVLLGYNWIRFLVLLLAAITLLVLEGPTSLLQVRQVKAVITASE